MTATPAHLTHIRTDLVHAIAIDAGRARRRRARLRIGGAALAGAALVGAIAVGIPSGGEHVDPAAAAVLREAAITAANQPALPALTPGHYYHFTDTETAWVEQRPLRAKPGAGVVACMTACPAPPSNWAVKALVKSRLWVAADGAGLRTLTVGRPVTFRNARVRADYAAGKYGYPVRHPFGIPTPTRFSPGRATGWSFGEDLTLQQIEHLPVNPDKLGAIVRRLAEGTANPLDAEEFTVVGDIMRGAPIRPRVRAAFYTVLSRLPGVTLVGQVTDPLGRPGIEVASAGQVLIFDSHTAQLLSEGGGGYSGWSVVDSIPKESP
jgi:hypothetical protein